MGRRGNTGTRLLSPKEWHLLRHNWILTLLLWLSITFLSAYYIAYAITPFKILPSSANNFAKAKAQMWACFFQTELVIMAPLECKVIIKISLGGILVDWDWFLEPGSREPSPFPSASSPAFIQNKSNGAGLPLVDITAAPLASGSSLPPQSYGNCKILPSVEWLCPLMGLSGSAPVRSPGSGGNYNNLLSPFDATSSATGGLSLWDPSLPLSQARSRSLSPNPFNELDSESRFRTVWQENLQLRQLLQTSEQARVVAERETSALKYVASNFLIIQCMTIW